MMQMEHAGSATGFRHPLLSQLEIVLDRMADGMVVVDAHARIRHVNRPARELLAKVRAEHASAGVLSFLDPRTQRAFERSLRAQHDDWSDDEQPARRDFLVRDARGVTIARASVEPLRRSSQGESDEERHLVTLHQLPQHAVVSVDTLAALYGLTPGEARVASQVIAARSVCDLAERVQLSRNTVKTHLKRTFRKCEVNSLAQLTALIATGPRVR